MLMSIRSRASLGAAICLLLAPDASAQRAAVAPNQFRGSLMTQGPGSHIGVTVRDLEPAEPNASAGGAVIANVSPNSPAATAGLQVSDVVVEFDGERVRSARQFARLVQETPPGRAVRTTIVRDGKRQDLTLTPTDQAPPGAFFDRGQIDDLVRGFEKMPQLRLLGTPRLGATVQDMTPELAEYFGADAGVLVSSITDNSAAERGGLQVGDVITSAGGQRVRSQTDLTQALRNATGSIALEVIRDRKPAMVTVTIPALPTTRMLRGHVI